MNKNENYIGVFDSGLGGLTVVDGLIKAMPDENIIYFGDTANMPYGTKTKEQITECVLHNMEFLTKFDVKAIVIACNTADSIVRKKLDEIYDLPIFGVIAPASKEAVESTKNKKIGLMATDAAVNSGAYEKEIHKLDPSVCVTSVACPLLVPLIEEGHFMRGDEKAVRALGEYLKPIKESGVDTLILGCTHYPLLSQTISDMLPEVKLISSSAAAANAAKAELGSLKKANTNDQKPTRRFFVSKDPTAFSKNAKIILGEEISASLAVMSDLGLS